MIKFKELLIETQQKTIYRRVSNYKERTLPFLYSILAVNLGKKPNAKTMLTIIYKEGIPSSVSLNRLFTKMINDFKQFPSYESSLILGERKLIVYFKDLYKDFIKQTRDIEMGIKLNITRLINFKGLLTLNIASSTYWIHLWKLAVSNISKQKGLTLLAKTKLLKAKSYWTEANTNMWLKLLGTKTTVKDGQVLSYDVLYNGKPLGMGFALFIVRGLNNEYYIFSNAFLIGNNGLIAFTKLNKVNRPVSDSKVLIAFLHEVLLALKYIKV